MGIFKGQGFQKVFKIYLKIHSVEFLSLVRCRHSNQRLSQFSFWQIPREGLSFAIRYPTVQYYDWLPCISDCALAQWSLIVSNKYHDRRFHKTSQLLTGLATANRTGTPIWGCRYAMYLRGYFVTVIAESHVRSHRSISKVGSICSSFQHLEI